jgi:hypothetical protein
MSFECNRMIDKLPHEGTFICAKCGRYGKASVLSIYADCQQCCARQKLRGFGISGADASFYLHEVSEATMMGRGLSYEAAHAGALGKYGVSPFSVYAPEVVAANPGSFNSNWFAFWGISR